MDWLISEPELQLKHFQSLSTCHRLSELLSRLPNWQNQIAGTELALDLPEQRYDGKEWVGFTTLAPLAFECGWISTEEAVLCPGRVLSTSLGLCPLNVGHMPFPEC